MKIPVNFSDLIQSPYFTEGNALFATGRIIVSGVEQNDSVIKISGFHQSYPGIRQKLILSSDGFIRETYCAEHGDIFCEHVVALALRYNEMAVDGEKLVEQFDKIVSVDAEVPKETSYDLEMRDKRLYLSDSSLRNSSGILSGIINPTNLYSFIYLKNDLFSFNGKDVQRGIFPLQVFYSIDNDNIVFSLPDYMIFDQSSGVLFDFESSKVWFIGSGNAQILSSLLSFDTIFTKDREELIISLERLKSRLRNVFIFSGNLTMYENFVEEGSLLFNIKADHKKLKLLITISTDSGEIEFRPGRKNQDQKYTVGENLISLSPNFVKLIKNGVVEAGFKFNKGAYTAPLSLLPSIDDGTNALFKIGQVLSVPNMKNIEIDEANVDYSSIEFNINADKGWFSFSIKLPDTVFPLPDNALIDAIKQVSAGIEVPVVYTDDGLPVILRKSVPFLTKLKEMFLENSFLPSEKLTMAYLPAMLQKVKNRKVSNFEGSEYLRAEYIKIIDAFSSDTFPEVEIPKEVSGTLRKYQKSGIAWMSVLKTMGLGGILADEMGLGKTLQALSFISMIKSDEPSIVIAPRTLLWSWDGEISKFFPHMKRTVIDSLPPFERKKLWQNAEKLIITSYSILASDIDLIKKMTFDTIVLDEAQHIKNSSTKRFKSVKMISGRHRFILTGTPIENHAKELWTLFNFLMPGFLPAKKEMERMEKNSDFEGFEKVSSQVSPFILRRMKKDHVEELPPVTISEVPVKMTQKQNDIYLSMLLRSRAEFIESGGEMNKVQILALLSKLRLAANHPSLVSEQPFDDEESGKIQLTMELINEIKDSGGRVLVFSQYVKVLKIVESLLNKNNVSYVYMDGQTKDRQSVIDTFNTGNYSAFLLTLKVGGVGLNLTAADNVIIIDPWWNPAAEEQAYSRAHRIGQTRKVSVYKLFSRETIEEKILTMQKTKKNLIDFFMSRSMEEPTKDFVKMLAEMEFAQNI